MQCDHLISCEAALSLWSQDHELCAAVKESRRSLPDFFKAFKGREPAQRDFMVVVMQRERDVLTPLGILVERIIDDTVEGCAVPNKLVCQAAGPLQCQVAEIIDWRFTDTFELVGGRLFLALFCRQRSPVRRALENTQTFLLLNLRRKEPVDAEFRQLLRDVANLRYAEVKRKLEANPSLAEKVGKGPFRVLRPYGRPPGRIVLTDTAIPTFAAHYSDADMIRLLHDLGLLRDVTGCSPLLSDSAHVGNLETTRCLLELGFDPNDNRSIRPLVCAATFDHREVVRELLAHGADCNIRDESLRSVIFFAGSKAVASLLIDAGARLDVVNENGETAVQYHMEYGRIGIANELVRHGAKAVPQSQWGPSDTEVVAWGMRDFKQYLEQHDPQGLKNLEIQESVDYGCVLPIRSIPVSGASEP